MRITVDALFAGALAPLGDRKVPSGMLKRCIPGPWWISSTGLRGDQQGDTQHHGGPEKALHHYPREHYPVWAAEEPALLGALASPPAFGENLSPIGMTEGSVCIGDTYQLGGALLQVSQGRQPCWKLNARFDRPDMAFRVQTTGRTGWYYRVLQEGWVEPGDLIVLVDRPRPAWRLARAIELLYRRTLDLEGLAELANVPELAAPWQELAARRVAQNSVEDWTKRLTGEA